MEEITLKHSNPFAELLSSRDLLDWSEPAPTQEALAVDPLEKKLPATGDGQTWRTLAEILLALPKIDKDLLARQAATVQLNKENLNSKLDLRLAGRKAQKTWDIILDRFAGSGLLIREGEGYRVAPSGPEKGAADPKSKRSFALQKVYDDYVQAMALAWQEAS
jgi:hypothetical protein